MHTQQSSDIFRKWITTEHPHKTQYKFTFRQNENLQLDDFERRENDAFELNIETEFLI